LAASNGDLSVALRLYEENTRLAEAFYTPLQCLEVCFRNCLEGQLAARYGIDWYGNGSIRFSVGSDQQIHDAISQLNIARRPITAAEIIPELKFAFWVGILAAHYDNTLWRQSLFRAFHAGRPRNVVHGRFNALRRFRNRVMHHEPIFDRPLQQLHDEIIEAIGWMCRDTSAWAAHHSRFAAVSVSIARPGANP
jgi:hypothetical protein